MPKYKTLLIDRFLNKVNKTDSCWIWLGAKQTSGYGRFYNGDLNKVIGSHQFSYLYFIGQIPNGINVCHNCDNPSCVNPNHLFLGTQKDNLKDMFKKGRGRKLNTYKSGTKHFKAKLSQKDIKRIRNLYNTGELNSYELGDIYNVHRTTINRLIRKETYQNE